ncbi:hypothetical protein KQI30_12380 [Clostridium bornimense]|uniref:hypothetical protein n=1 Tax=Clostridium bornimense TaxID=1216932 RepID=UPI001C11783E|nr:hypothetical protein [Clostridium bornimense]MBU5317053.1 hypothetical protein [Clostridium bornimense]
MIRVMCVIDRDDYKAIGLHKGWHYKIKEILCSGKVKVCNAVDGVVVPEWIDSSDFFIVGTNIPFSEKNKYFDLRCRE